MRKINKKIIPVLLVGGILTGNVAFVTSKASASTVDNQNVQMQETAISGQDEQSIVELAEAFQFMHEEAAIYNDQGQITDFDFNKIEAKYGKHASLDALKQQVESDKSKNGRVKRDFVGCIKDSLMDFFGVNAVQAAINGGLSYYLEKKLWKEAAKIGVKFFVGSNIAGLAGTLAYYGGKCAIYG
ncbi:hypothetical protein [Bacillus mycoides]|uniref:hypothetical protein n=1 Tax=Bacillus mycoides TaxID=1405 RepID=UPI0021110D02|nr:hypothetical protein [Bacillus mycoides]MCQ6530605.1 hypothetical protein [Bacillus mycoides]